MRTSEEVEGREEEDPDQVDEMPVEAGILHPVCEMLGIRLPHPAAPGEQEGVDDDPALRWPVRRSDADQHVAGEERAEEHDLAGEEEPDAELPVREPRHGVWLHHVGDDGLAHLRPPPGTAANSPWSSPARCTRRARGTPPAR